MFRGETFIGKGPSMDEERRGRWESGEGKRHS